MTKTKVTATIIAAIITILCCIAYCAVIPDASVLALIAYSVISTLVLIAYCQAIYYSLDFVLDAILHAARKI